MRLISASWLETSSLEWGGPKCRMVARRELLCASPHRDGSVAGQTSTHLPQRVQASIMASTRPCSADSKLAVMAIS